MFSPKLLPATLTKKISLQSSTSTLVADFLYANAIAYTSISAFAYSLVKS